jgi:hypothetical protein
MEMQEARKNKINVCTKWIANRSRQHNHAVTGIMIVTRNGAAGGKITK